MTEVILNERKWCEDMLNGFSLGTSPYMTLVRLGRYYHASGKKPAAIRRLLEEFILRCNPMANLLRWNKCVESSVKNSEMPLVEIDSVPIYQEELDKIEKLSGKMQQRLMFTLLCLAKFRCSVNPLSGGWVSYALKDIFRMEGSQLSSMRQYTLINDLYRAQYIELGRSVDNTSIRVVIASQGSNQSPALRIKDFRNLGGQYINHIQGGFLQCERCGLTVRRSSNRQKYCRDCAKMTHEKKSSFVVETPQQNAG